MDILALGVRKVYGKETLVTSKYKKLQKIIIGTGISQEKPKGPGPPLL